MKTQNNEINNEINENKIIRTIKANGSDEFEFINSLTDRDSGEDQRIAEVVREIIQNVKSGGDKALLTYEQKFGASANGQRPEKLAELTRSDLKDAYERVEEDFREAIIAASSNIKMYHKKQEPTGYELKDDNNCVIGQVSRGLSRVGLYVPGGTAAYPSTVLMNAIPAQIAGVGEIIMVTPNGNDNVLAAAFVAGVERVFLIGGAQAVAALAYGTETVPQVDKIVGPGNAYVAEAKRQVFGQVDIDMIAGPSEILIMADEAATPSFIAADLLSQAEHDVMSASILLTTDETIAEGTEKELESQLETLERSEFAAQALTNNGAIIICRSDDEMVKLANMIAPEHLEIMTDNPMGYIHDIKNAGSVFCGDYSPEPLGDYYSGTNHVLPTSGTARFASPLGVYDFVKKMSYTYYTKEGLKKAKDDIIKIGEVEGLTAHVNSVKKRFE